MAAFGSECRASFLLLGRPVPGGPHLEAEGQAVGGGAGGAALQGLLVLLVVLALLTGSCNELCSPPAGPGGGECAWQVGDGAEGPWQVLGGRFSCALLVHH